MRRLLALFLTVPVFITGCVAHEIRETIPGRYPVAPEHVIHGLRSGVPESQIVSDIRTQGILRPPTTDEIVAIKQSGGSDWVVREMIAGDVTIPRPAEERRTVVYDTRPAETAVTFGAGVLAGWALFGHHKSDHHHHHHRHYRRYR
jgi:hypothetical protein